MEFNKVVVTGIGALTPVGNNLESFWTGLKAGISGACPITKFDTEPFKTKFACELKDFDILDHLDKKVARRMDPYTHYALVASDQALTHYFTASPTVAMVSACSSGIWRSGQE